MWGARPLHESQHLQSTFWLCSSVAFFDLLFGLDWIVVVFWECLVENITCGQWENNCNNFLHLLLIANRSFFDHVCLVWLWSCCHCCCCCCCCFWVFHLLLLLFLMQNERQNKGQVLGCSWCGDGMGSLHPTTFSTMQCDCDILLKFCIWCPYIEACGAPTQHQLNKMQVLWSTWDYQTTRSRISIPNQLLCLFPQRKARCVSTFPQQNKVRDVLWVCNPELLVPFKNGCQPKSQTWEKGVEAPNLS